MNRVILYCLLLLSFKAFGHGSFNPDEKIYWMKVSAKSAEERTAISNSGAVIESVNEDYVTLIAKEFEKPMIDRLGRTEVSFLMTAEMMDFPENDENFHNYDELYQAMSDLEKKHNQIVQLQVLGKSYEGQDIHIITISGSKNIANQSSLPATLFVGTHHAREHLSTEMPIKLAQYITDQYEQKNPRIMDLVNSRVIYIIPLLNPDGSEHDIASGSYKMWRKNRRKNANGTFGVDLNRNYGYKWGQDGASPNPGSDTYRGTEPFSEPETQLIKNFVESRSHITTLLSFHTFSELILYPWGYTLDPIAKEEDRKVFETIANKMSAWNGYKAMTGSQLYLVSGEMGDWAYGEKGIFSFTFELDPKGLWQGGFYPGQSFIDPVFKKNLEPCLYLIELADNPYKVLRSKSQQLGLKSNLF